MNDNAVAEGVTVQGNTITGSGNGVRLEANGTGAFIDADGTIGGNGVNVYNGTSFTQGNILSNNTLNGFMALAANGGSIDGNLINNTITDNGENGVALLIDNGGFVDFGTTGSNRVILDNTITGNGNAGIRLTSNVTATTQAQLDAVIYGNDISNNDQGGIVAQLNGPNNTPPGPPGTQENNILNLTVGGAATAQANTIDANGDVGVGVEARDNGLANIEIINNTITGTTDGPDPILNGDGVNITRASSALVQADIEDNTITATLVTVWMSMFRSGQERPEPASAGTVNTVNWNRNNLSNNGANGARFRTRGDSMLIADGSNNTLNGNGANGILVQTSENSSFGDPTMVCHQDDAFSLTATSCETTIRMVSTFLRPNHPEL